jgi:hypothetical protein
MSQSLDVVCPDCNSSLPLDDVNVANDIALCRNCAKSFSFAVVVRQEDEGPVDLTRPVKGVSYRRTPSGFELACSTRSAAAFFLVPFMLVWSGGSLGGIYGTQIAKGHFSLLQSLFGLPFLFGTVLFGSLAIMTVCGKFSVRAEGKDGEIFIGACGVGYRKKFRWDEVKDIRIETRATTNGRDCPQIVIDAGNPITIPNVTAGRMNYFFRALRQLHRDFFPVARAVPPKISEAA